MQITFRMLELMLRRVQKSHSGNPEAMSHSRLGKQLCSVAEASCLNVRALAVAMGREIGLNGERAKPAAPMRNRHVKSLSQTQDATHKLKIKTGTMACRRGATGRY
jgi:hypothetical protein